MNNRIKMLDDLTISKIAAGEVIDAPYSVVKELIENSIDAKATAIVLEIKEGGKKYIRVTDNGIGIKEEYVEKAFMRHSTSKITNIDDLNDISFLGFRGEALASIAAVSQIEMFTRVKDQNYGVLIEIIGGKTKSIKKIGCPIGTVVAVKNLFFNTPARLKFMKSNSAETAKISKIITRLSLGNPDIAFKYINNNKIIFTTPGNKMLSETILSVFDKNIFKNLIFLEENKQTMKLHGYIGQPNFVRGNRDLQIVYINGRYVKSRLISEAIERAYKEKIIINKFPICILNLNINPSEIDVNVHPSKTEIKFEREKQIQEFIYKSIIKALEKKTIIPQLLITEHKNQTNPKLSIVSETPTTINNIGNIEKDSKTIRKGISANKSNKHYTQKFRTEKNVQLIAKQDKISKKLIQVNNMPKDTTQTSFLEILINQYKIIGQIFNTYIVLEKDQSIYLIDQHAAHERLLYNKFLKEIKNEKVVSQKLIKSKILELSNEDYILLYDNMDLFHKLGFCIENFGTNTIIIREVPMILGEPQDFSFIYEVLDEIKDNNNNVTNYFENSLIKKACKKAVKANDKLNYCEIEQLIKELCELTPPLTCPHGRPIVLTIRQYDIEKYFKRVQ